MDGDNLMMQKAMALLNETERRILTMRFFENKTQMEVAGALGLSQPAVSRMEKKGLNDLRTHLDHIRYSENQE